jgi:hypothetical protein
MRYGCFQCRHLISIAVKERNNIAKVNFGSSYFPHELLDCPFFFPSAFQRARSEQKENWGIGEVSGTKETMQVKFIGCPDFKSFCEDRWLNKQLGSNCSQVGVCIYCLYIVYCFILYVYVLYHVYYVPRIIEDLKKDKTNSPRWGQYLGTEWAKMGRNVQLIGDP